jgi:hypothetical protein
MCSATTTAATFAIMIYSSTNVDAAILRFFNSFSFDKKSYTRPLK